VDSTQTTHIAGDLDEK
jgi:hypothetical protein